MPSAAYLCYRPGDVPFLTASLDEAQQLSDDGFVVMEFELKRRLWPRPAAPLAAPLPL